MGRENMRKVFCMLLIALAIFSFASCKKDPPHEHTFSSTWAYDENYHWHESTCGHDVTAGNAPHNWDAGVITTEPTHTTAGVRTCTCTICGAKKTESVPANTEAHTFSTEWSSDADTHWHAATCVHTTLQSEQSVHIWDGGVITTPATCTDAGVRTYTCIVCGRTETESVPATGHAYSGVITTPAGCTTPGVRTFTCSRCSDSYTTEIPATGVHTYSNEWTYDSLYHWHASNCECTDKKKDEAAHSYPSKATAVLQSDGTYKFGYTCTTCGYIRLVSTANVGDIGPAGGKVFYDKGEYSDGWRFLEAAPADLYVVEDNGEYLLLVDNTHPLYNASNMVEKFVFGYYRTADDGDNLYINGTTYNAADCTGTATGTGANNTALLVGAMGSSTYSESSGTTKTGQYAAKLCADLEYNGFDDWFLPSKDELSLMYTNRSKIGGFVSTNNDPYYWSSSEGDTIAGHAWYKNFYNGSQYGVNRNYFYRVRPVRAF